MKVITHTFENVRGRVIENLHLHYEFWMLLYLPESPLPLQRADAVLSQPGLPRQGGAPVAPDYLKFIKECQQHKGIGDLQNQKI